MGVSSGPEIINSDLALYYDASNTSKSWRGKPTTNLLDVGLGAVQMVSLAYVGLEDGWKKYSLNGTWTAGTYPYAIAINGPTFTGGVSYSAACYLKTNVPQKFNYFGTGMNYVNEPMNKGGAPFGILQPDGSYYCGRSDFEYTSTTAQAGYILSNPVANAVFNSSTDFVWIKDGQVEQGSFPTPFAGNAGTRSNTQAILDLTGQRTITATSLTYNSDGSFSFNGSNNYISVNNVNLNHGTSNFTYSAWLNFAALPSHGTVFENGSWGNSILLRFENTGFTVYSMSAYFGFFPFTPTLNTWYNVAFVRNGNSMLFYVNGEYIQTLAFGTSLNVAPSPNNLFIGMSQHASGQCFNGRIKAASVYTRALTDEEIRENFVALRGQYGI